MSVRVWVEAARPRTLPAAVTPVLVGTASADRFVAWRAFAALVVALALQVAVNFANDYFDAASGVDTPDRIGPRRAVAAGLVAGPTMRRAMLVALLVAALGGLALTVAVGWELLVVGALAGVAALGYSGGRRPYASLGFGELAVFVFFGLVATVGSQYVQDETVGSVAVVAAVPVGLLATALLVVNNLRDIATDAAAGKRTLAVRIGERRTRRLFQVLVWGAFATLAVLVVVTGAGWVLLPVLAVPLAYRAVALVRQAPPGPRLIAALELTGRAHLVFGVLLAVGLVVTA